MTRSPSVSLLIGGGGPQAPPKLSLEAAEGGRGGAGRKARQNLLERAVVAAGGANVLPEAGWLAELEEGAAGGAGNPAEGARPQHRRDHPPNPATGLAGNAAVLGGGQRAISL